MISNKLHNTGFLIPKLDSTQYILGSMLSLPKIILQGNMQWGLSLPSEERQHRATFDTFNCTSFATLNCFEIILNKVYGKYENKSDRFLGIVAGTKPPGNDPHVVAEAGRKNGFINESSLPFDQDIDTVNEYYSFIFADENKCRKEGVGFINQYEIGHEWVFTGSISKSARMALMKEALQYSPLGVSVSGWHEQNGVYMDNGQPNNHWTVVYGFNEQGWLCFDSYSPYKKVISYDHDIRFCKRYSLKFKEQTKENWLISLIKTVLRQIRPVKTVPDPIPLAPQVKSPRERLYDAAVASLGMDASPRDVAPDEYGCAESVNEIHKKAFGEYIENPGISTTKLFAAMIERSDKFVRVIKPECGNIIISPTGFANIDNPPIKNGHVGIFGKDLKIMSSSSATGKFEENYTLDTWINRYRKRGFYPIIYFKRI